MLRPFTVAVLSLLVFAAAAPAGSRSQIIKDCSDDSALSGSYSPSELRDARQNIPTDVDEYTDCADVLRSAELSAGRDSGGGGGGATAGASGAAGGSGGAAGGAVASGGATGATGAGSGAGGASGPPADPVKDAKELEEARLGGGGAVGVGERSIVPGSSGFAAESATRELPAALLVALVLLGLTALVAALPPLRRRARVLARRKG